ncbi:MAG: glycogen synthase GlgA [Sphingobium sp.]
MTIAVLSVASEAWPLLKTGGLADVVGALPDAVAPHGVKMTNMLPGYPAVMNAIGKGKVIHRYDSLLGAGAQILYAKAHNLLVLDAPALFTREAGPYADAQGRDWADNWQRFAALSRAAADLASGAVKGQAFDILHAHDWQAALAPAYLRYGATGEPAGNTPVPSVMTIHNIAFQGYFGPEIFPRLELPRGAWAIDGVEYHGGVGFLKAGMEAASAITTVSPSYAAEIRNAEFGLGLEGLIVSRGDRVSGILNGIDSAIWNPATDEHLSAPFTARTLKSRRINKRAVEASFGLDQDDGPLFIVVSRLTWQKGIDVLLEVLDHLVGMGGRLALLGSGDAALEAGLHAAAGRHPGRIAVRIGYDEALSHQMQGGGDAILVPSRYEPCGLTQLYGLAYGCVPVVARTGGLADSVIDANPAAIAAKVATGIQFTDVTYDNLAHAITRACRLYAQPPVWQTIQKCGMRADFSWGQSGKAYADLYARLMRGE